MKYFVRVTLAVAAAALLGFGCSKKGQMAKATAFPDSVVINEVIATVNGDTIRGRDLKVLAYVSMVGPDSMRSRSFNTKLLDQLIDRTLFVHEAQAAGVSAPDSTVDKLMKQFTANFTANLANELTKEGLKPADFRRAIEHDLLIRTYINQKVQPAITVSDADCKAFFDQHEQAFAGVDSVHARHIILQFSPGDTDKSRNDREKLMSSIHDRIMKGEKFERLAKMYSQDSSAERGGDLGFFARGTMVKEFEDVAFSLKKGELSPVFKTQFGLHLVQCLDKKAAAPPNYNNAKPRIEAMLKNQALGSDLQNRLKRDRATAIIVRNYNYEDKSAAKTKKTGA